MSLRGRKIYATDVEQSWSYTVSIKFQTVPEGMLKMKGKLVFTPSSHVTKKEFGFCDSFKSLCR